MSHRQTGKKGLPTGYGQTWDQKLAKSSKLCLDFKGKDIAFERKSGKIVN